MKGTRLMVVCLGILLCAQSAYAGIGIAARAGTQGLGIEVTKSLVPVVNVRGGGYFLGYGRDVTKDDITYDFDLKLRSFSLMMDVHPIPLMGFRLSGGLILNNNRVDMTAVPQGTYEIGGQTYSGAQVGQLLGEMTFRKAAPYVGLGWGNATRSRIGFAFDLGVAFQGTPNVDLDVTGPIAQDPNFRADLQREEQNIQDDVKIFKYYPVVSIGLSFKLSAF